MLEPQYSRQSSLLHHGSVWLSSIYSKLTLYCRCGLAYPYDWKGFVGDKKNTSVGLLIYYSFMPSKQQKLNHRVDRVLGFFLSRPSWDPPSTPSPADECVPHPLWFRGWDTPECGRGVGGPNSDEGTGTVVLKLYMYFVG